MTNKTKPQNKRRQISSANKHRSTQEGWGLKFLLRKLEKQQKKGEEELVSTESRFDQKSYGRHQTNT